MIIFNVHTDCSVIKVVYLESRKSVKNLLCNELRAERITFLV